MKVYVNGILLKKGLEIKIEGQKSYRPFNLEYPKRVWEMYPAQNRKALLDNLSFVSTCHLPFQNPKIAEINFNGYRPVVEASYFKNLFYTIPFDAYMNKQKSADLYRILLNTDFHFRKERKLLDLPPARIKLNREKAIIPFTFGKDSLLTYAMSIKLGISPRLMFIIEPKELYADKHKREMLKQFNAEFGQDVTFFLNPSGILRDDSAGNGWFGWELLLTSFTLFSLPFAYYDKAKYILFSNEASCNESIKNEEGIIFNPVYEQSENWTREESLIAQAVSGQDIKVASIVGPLHEIAIVKILHTQFPEIGKYQMSCFADRPEAENKRWCAACCKCARNYIFLLANGIDPKTVGFTDDLLQERYKSLYSIFEDTDGKEGYDATELGRDEQMLAFLMAYQKGSRGPLMSEFKKKYYAQARKKEPQLRRKYLRVQPSGVLPDEFQKAIISYFERVITQ
ncbi:MAG: hypothetical protein AAB486_02865 [Patescibacteria group bacterium]